MRSSSPAIKNNISYETGTDGLRGIAAMLVLYTHLLWGAHHVDPGYIPSARFMWLEASQGAVLLFFVLSGYVIGLTNAADFSAAAVKQYAKRRVIRIVPMCWAAIVLSILVRPGDSTTTIFGNFLFLQNELDYGVLSIRVIGGNTNLWSLNYEFVYYCAFPLIWYLGRNRPKECIALGLILGAFSFWIPVVGPLLGCYSVGWVFWVSGYYIAQSPISDETDSTSRLPWPSLFFLWIATWHIKPLWHVCHRFSLLPAEATWLNYSYYDFLPACLCLILAASGRRPKLTNILVSITFVIPFAYMAWQTVRGRFFQDTLNIDLLFVILAVVLIRWRPSSRFFKSLSVLGSISYGIYIFQRPAQWLIADNNWLPQGTWWSYSIRFTIILVITLAISWLMERNLQPKLKTWFTRPRTRTS